ncbi:MAG: TetR family transcriptional regulator [Burkholderiales bacterium]|nr:TetR family transcriptional regulator [Burkholderiales bacterium]MDE2453730.1 TetR family transcriptional regulator [Burkholderiales bacterium]
MKTASNRKQSEPAGVREARSSAPASAKAVKASSKRAANDRTLPLNPDAPEDIRDAVSRLKRERIIATAVELFYNNGLSNTTLEAVADQMKVTKPFIYAHFKSKSELLAEICSRGIRASLDALNRVVATQGTASEKLQSLARDFMFAVLSNQAHIAIYNREEKHLSPEDSEAINEMRREFDRKFCALLEEGVATGEFVVDDVHIASLAIGGIVSWSYVWYRPNGRLSPAETADQVADLVMAMVQAKSVKRRRAKTAG